ncbi:succinyl-CoA synthetase, NAD(P)-binding, alpha subunit [Candidatus Filomicrobium marinum]|uniref:Succinyl-CoA synthetase, NAD(P)-binding, alpha subunit n=1 Tax=Candidatus Filomicrobium marinum TaxID=1608628 RepID=A0A0D6JJM5_9HYPH|nr:MULTISPECIES: succinate--CoA ligase subunit alpha [Filomicrobium]MCV0371567.1 succinate--CoA ligase subunit alpha [Filomicrobium sp.]CFX54267.1 succinyl-CoA synthetase, NAD(P)-binding, alpha subunit [Candidatus Filomicrobium marinum]CPR22136.1 succinyl-CoA synthetase, NAD(P)-binding, alpha subunit [Candidatus Filomicrobium marinum]
MAVLIGPETKVLCQGMTGRTATFHCGRMLSYGTQLVAGVVPGKGGNRHLDLPVYNHVREAIDATGANATIVFVPPNNAAAAIIEAIEAELPLIVCVTERIPILDMVRVRQALIGTQTRLIGPNSQGILVPGVTQLGVMSTVDASPGRIGIASRSASLTSEIVLQTTQAGLGQSTTIGVGGDPVHGVDLKTCVKLFLDDPDTDGVIVIGEIGGTEEEEAAELISELKPTKPIVALVAGRHAPPERRMGHAGAFASSSGGGTALSKIAALQSAGVVVAPNAATVGETMRKTLAV